jgi:hypothetical protein
LVPTHSDSRRNAQVITGGEVVPEVVTEVVPEVVTEVVNEEIEVAVNENVCL